MLMSAQSIIQSLGSGRKALKGGDFKQVGGEFLFENGQCTWAHRMRTTRDHTEIVETRKLLGLDETRPPMRKRWSHDIKPAKPERRSMSWGRFRRQSRVVNDVKEKGSGSVTPEKVVE